MKILSFVIKLIRANQCKLISFSFSLDHLMGLSHLSQNKTATLFTQLYRGHATRTVMPLANLYDDIRLILRSEGDLSTEGLSAGPPKDLTVTTKKFFRELFPVAYHNVLKLDAKQFTPDYEICLKDAYDAVQPFGDVPQQVFMFAYYLENIQVTTMSLLTIDIAIIVPDSPFRK